MPAGYQSAQAAATNTPLGLIQKATAASAPLQNGRRRNAIHTAAGLTAAVKQLNATIGIEKVRVIHANDSKTAFESHADRHEHIGEGQIGAEAFKRIVRHPMLKDIPFICETPVDKPDDDVRNIEMMRKLAGVQVRGKRR